MPLDAALPGELREDDDFTTALYRAAIGPVNTRYYLAIFTGWENSSRWMPRWNTAAGLWTLGWLAFRKMGGAALAYVAALVGSVLLVFGVGRLFFNLSETGQIIMVFIWLLIAVLVPGLWGNVWFHSHCRKRMANALQAHTEVAQSCAVLARQSSQPRRAMAVGTAQLSLLVALGLGAVQFSSLAQQTGGKPAVASPATPQMASGKVKDYPAPAASAPVSPVPPIAPVAPASAAPPREVAPPSPVAVAVAAAPKPGVTAKTPVGRYGVNVGLFANAVNAKNALNKLEAAGLPTKIDALNMKRGPRTRIQVGPFTTQTQADEAAGKIRALGLEAVTYQD